MRSILCQESELCSSYVKSKLVCGGALEADPVSSRPRLRSDHRALPRREAGAAGGGQRQAGGGTAVKGGVELSAEAWSPATKSSATSPRRVLHSRLSFPSRDRHKHGLSVFPSRERRGRRRLEPGPERLWQKTSQRKERFDAVWSEARTFVAQVR